MIYLLEDLISFIPTYYEADDYLLLCYGFATTDIISFNFNYFTSSIVKDLLNHSVAA